MALELGKRNKPAAEPQELEPDQGLQPPATAES
jgi:hypothetical protein